MSSGKGSSSMSADNREKLRLSLANLERGMARLGEALEEPETNPLAVDGTIQRFEFVLELFWKTLRRALLEEGIETATPREALTAANTAGWLGDGTLWLGMLKDRNETSHLYDDERARKVYARIKTYHPEMRHALTVLQSRYPA